MRLPLTAPALLVLGSCAVAADQVPPYMASLLTEVTPEMVEQIKQACPAEPVVKPGKPRKVLIFSRCGEGGDVHESILVSEKALVILGQKTGAYTADISYDYGVFDAARLAAYDALILNNSADIPFPQGAPRQALIDFVRNGKGIVGIHGAAENFNDFPEAKKMMGVQFAGHPFGGYIAWRFKVEDPKHPITTCLDPAGFTMQDEQFQYDPWVTNRRTVRVLVGLDMTDPNLKGEDGKTKGFARPDGDNPIVWVRHEGQGRVFYNGFGHNNETHWNTTMLTLNLAGIQYAIGDLKADDSIIPKP